VKGIGRARRGEWEGEEREGGDREGKREGGDREGKREGEEREGGNIAREGLILQLLLEHRVNCLLDVFYQSLGSGDLQLDLLCSLLQVSASVSVSIVTRFSVTPFPRVMVVLVVGMTVTETSWL
jgi:hypothetical protein